MSVTHTLYVNWSSGGNSLNGTVAVVSDFEVNESSTYPITATNYLRTVSIPVAGSRLKSVFMLSSTDVTVKTNTTGGTDTIVLKAKVPYVWTTGMGACPFTADITALYLTGTNAAIGQFDLRCLCSS